MNNIEILNLNKMKHYPEVNREPSFSSIEQEILSWWQKNNIFEKSVEGEKEFILYDGPPFANGLPHYGHLLTGFVKDVVARYQTMKSNKVERRFGWDCHGLPAEMGAEKELSISGKIEIEKFGVDKFNQYCRDSVLKYTKEWEYYVNRQARWVDFINDYKTMNIGYMESVIWAFKELYDKGLIYKSMRVMPYSWACETPVSDFETRIDNSYRDKNSKSVTVAFKILNRKNLNGKISIPEAFDDLRIIVWTTTPWTLPSNLALAVGADIDYIVSHKNNRYYIIAQSLAHNYEPEIGSEYIYGPIKGKDLVGMTYEPLFNCFKNHNNAFKILHADFVTTENGTGIVHIAPGFGEDDQKLCESENIELVCPVDNSGRFTAPVNDYLGMQVFETNDSIILLLKKNGNWLRTEQYKHKYPHCWRTDTPLIYKAVPSWYLNVEAIKNKMIENNKNINWIPSHIKFGLFGKWLENARDWSISRNRYWGCPVPIWQSDDPKYPHIEVYGSIADLEKAFETKVTDLHKPFIDNLVKKNPSDPTGKSMLRRVPEVLDCWFESGSMPYAQVHYPFENRNWFENHFPADFIVEYVAQTRGWFYTMMVLSTALFDKPPFLNCICHGVILGDDGEKLSKRLKNYVDPNEIFSKYGSDAMRWAMMSSPVLKGNELIMSENAVNEAIRSVIKPLWNAYSFFILYANADCIKAELNLNSEQILDRYIISKCISTINAVELSMDRYDIIAATKYMEEFIEVLNNWYIRRSRERFWRSKKDQDKINAYNTLYSVIILICRAAAPLLPLITESIYQGLNQNYSNGQDSVHLKTFPDYKNFNIDNELILNMDRVREACTTALKIRNNAKIKVRQPLNKVTFVGVSSNADIAPEMRQIVLDEINVKQWENLPRSEITKYATFQLQLNLSALGKRLPNKVQEILSASKNWHYKEGEKVIIASEELTNEEFQIKLKPDSNLGIETMNSNDALIILDLNLNEDLILEGIGRDLVRSIQQKRKDANLDISDKIETTIVSNKEKVVNAIHQMEDYIKSQTLSVKIIIEEEGGSIKEDIKIKKIDVE